jgi:hypothetical protein
MRQPATAREAGRRRRTGFRAFLVTERSVSVLIILVIVLAVGGVVLRVVFFRTWFLWFWAMTAFTALELLVTAAWDLVADLRGSAVHLVTDHPAPWPVWVQRALVPVLLAAGILVDHYVVH